ncbi:hypothetical protein QAD02_002145 [Eretmocerus hayati]|uniref:Uncharacterized protein n=1 Tax=Eretmocerus hayati TaxID=131215 RepID=A0ACC2NJU2_9HYME|nr:hypothetical protein QAD02_002145 [Eretmocerus hayati]
MYRKRIYTSLSYTRCENRLNDMIILENNELARIAAVFCVKSALSTTSRFVIVGKKLHLSQRALCVVGDFDSNLMWQMVRQTEGMGCFDHSSIRNKCMDVPVDDELSCAIPLLNRVETD